ncbi:NAD-dependent epimerase/dehydratase family protein [Hymenobacter tenuis]
MKTKKTIFLTGASGNMGHEGLKQLLERRDRFDIVALALPTKKDRKIMSPYERLPGVKIVWGDLTVYEDVLRCVAGSDFVLHVGGMVSPAADYLPALTTKVNIGAARNIVKAIQAQPNREEIKLVYIGTVAQTGDRNPPLHWGRTGDPIKISAYDNYALTKTIAEREVIESGLKYWVSLRQTGMLYHGINKGLDPIMFHVPVNGVFEWATAQDSGRMLANACEETVPEEFWRRIYNIGGGEKYRTHNYDFLQRSGSAAGIDVKQVFDLNWFATQNFHGQWYEDSDVLENYLHYRSGSIDDYLAEVRQKSSLSGFMAKLIPASILRKYVMKPVAYKKEYGTMYWLENNETEKVKAYFGSQEQWESIPSWENFTPKKPSYIPRRLQHGYDETKPKQELDLPDMVAAATFRGGACLSTTMQRGELNRKLQWKCAVGHEFEASPTLVLLAGHWCPTCLAAPIDEQAEAARNPFFAQVVSPGI